MITKDLGVVTAYGYAVTKGYTGTEEEFAELMASYATVAEQAAQSAQTATEKAQAAAQAVLDAVAAKDAAVQAKNGAVDAKDAAAQSATNAASSATAASGSATNASQSASSAQTSAESAAGSANSASQSATDANTAKTDAQTAKADAETAKAEAETAQAKAEEAQAKAEESANDLSAEVEQIETNKNDIANLKSDFNELNTKFQGVLKETTNTAMNKFAVTKNTYIVATEHVLDTDIPSGTAYTFRIDDNIGAISNYALYANGNFVNNYSVNTDVVLSASEDISYFSIYVARESVVATGELTVSCKFGLTFDDSAQGKAEYAYGNTKANRALEETDLLAGVPWEIGGIINGANVNNTLRIRSGFIDLTGIEKISCKIESGSSYQLYYYDLTKTFVTSSGWLHVDTIVSEIPTNAMYLRIMVDNNGNPHPIPITNTHIEVRGFTKLLKKLDDIENQFSEFLTESKNLLTETWKHAAYSGGNYHEITSGRNIAIPPIPVEYGGYYVASWGEAVAQRYRFTYVQLDASKTILTDSYIDIANNNSERKYAFNITNENTKYVGFQIYASGNTWQESIPEWTQLEKGFLQTEYEDANKMFLNPYRMSESVTDLPDYYFENGYLDKKCDRINELAREVASSGDVFAFITDQHWHLNQKESPKLLSYIDRKCHIPRLFSGGDTDDYGSEAFCNALRKNFSHKIHHVTGNHDWFSPIDGNDLYYWMDSYNDNQIGNMYEHYYYVDNHQKKLRYVVLNAYHRENGSSTVSSGYTSEQINWFESDALQVESGWDILVFTHYIGTTYTTDVNAQAIRDSIDAYNGEPNSPGHIIAIIQGHTHFDTVCHTTGGVPIITTTCDKNVGWISGGVNKEEWLTEYRASNTINEQAFDIMILDRESKQIKAVRIGAPAMDNTDKNYTDEGFDFSGTLEERTISYS